VSSSTRLILVVDDDAGFRALTCSILERAGYETIEAETGEMALELAAGELPGLVVLDVNLPGMSGYMVCNELRQSAGRRLPIIFVSGERTEAFDRVAGILIGADDYLAKPFDPDELVARVGRMLERASFYRVDPPSNGDAGLTPREREVLGLLADGLTQTEIAEGLCLSPKTVGTHIQRIMGKLGVKNRTQAVALAVRGGILDPVNGAGS
jgi:DNA-binding NarL/FixJ family response regulator